MVRCTPLTVSFQTIFYNFFGLATLIIFEPYPFTSKYNDLVIKSILNSHGTCRIIFEDDSFLDLFNKQYPLRDIKIPSKVKGVFNGLSVAKYSIIGYSPYNLYSLNGLNVFFKSDGDICSSYHYPPIKQSTDLVIPTESFIEGHIFTSDEMYSEILRNLFDTVMNTILKIEHSIPMDDGELDNLIRFIECTNHFKRTNEFLSQFQPVVQERLHIILEGHL